MYSINQVAKQLQVSKATLRYYDSYGILSPKRSESGYRIYDDNDLLLLKHILVFKRAGFSLDDIKIIINLYDCEEGQDGNQKIQEVFQRNTIKLKAQIQFLKFVVDSIEELLPLFGTYALYNVNKEKLFERIEELFIESKEYN